MNYSRTDRDQLSKVRDALQEGDPRPTMRESFWGRRRRLARESAEQRQKLITERDNARGYRINVKQVVLAFAVEFFIIGLILLGQYYIAQQAAGDRVLPILLFPIGLAVVELARVPLAIAVRTQNSWSVKLFAGLGVAAAVTVTTFSLSTIAYQTFDPRLIEANDKYNALQNWRSAKDIRKSEVEVADRDLEERRKQLSSANDRIKSLQEQISKVNAVKGENCTTVTNPDSTTSRSCTSANLNAAQSKTLQAQLASEQKDRDALDAAVRAAEAARAKYDLRSIDEQIAKAESDYRMAITHSQLHSYTSFVVRKAPTEVTDAEVKGLEFYLIFIPSIAAALASTLLAITAVHRIRLPKVEPAATMPDEALNFLLGPLVQTLQQEARNAVDGAMRARSNQGEVKSSAQTAKA